MIENPGHITFPNELIRKLKINITIILAYQTNIFADYTTDLIRGGYKESPEMWSSWNWNAPQPADIFIFLINYGDLILHIILS